MEPRFGFRVARSTAFATVIVASLTGFLSSCMVESHESCHGSGCGYSVPVTVVGCSGLAPQTSSQVTASIDIGQPLDATPGRGAGVFVEYTEGGRWHLFTACDTAISGADCIFNVLVSVKDGQSPSEVKTQGLGPDDTLCTYSGGFELAVATSTGLDGVTFQTAPNTTVYFEVFAGGVSDPRYLYWIGDGAVQAGAPSNPMGLEPRSR